MSKAKSTQETSHKSDDQGHERKSAPAHATQTPESPARRGSRLAHGGNYGLSPSAQPSPFSFMRRFGEEMDRLFEDFGFGGLGRGLMSSDIGGLGRTAWSPQIEMFEREGKLVVRADLPGMNKDDVKVDLEDDAITIQGERKSEHEENREGYYRTERSYGSFSRTIPLPEGVNGEDAKASFRNGVLEIVMEGPKRKGGRRLDIEDMPKAK
jgi:HSP20 family protein